MLLILHVSDNLVKLCWCFACERPCGCAVVVVGVVAVGGVVVVGVVVVVVGGGGVVVVGVADKC